MKIFLKIFVLVLLPCLSMAQQTLPDSLRIFFLNSKNDSILYKTGNQLYDYYEEVNRDSALFYADQCVKISRRNNKKLNEAHILTRKAYQELNLGRYAESLQSLLKSFTISENKENDKNYWDVGTLQVEKEKRLYALTCANHIYGILMRETMDNEHAIIHFKEAKRIAVEINSYARSLLASLNLGRIYLVSGNLDSALYFENEAASIVKSSGWEKYLSTILYYTGKIYLDKGDTLQAIHTFHQSVESALKQNNTDALTRAYHGLSNCYFNRAKKDSCIFYAVKSVDAVKRMGKITQIEYHLGDAYQGLYYAYQLNNEHDSVFKYLTLAHAVYDSIYQRRIKSLAEFQKLNLDEQRRLYRIQREETIYQNKIRSYAMLAGIGVFMLTAFLLYRNNRNRRKANNVLQQQKEELQSALTQLKSTQTQLIQSEKMASLGELTAGIAHEIQNPLNFVNNFSEVSNELIAEMIDEIEKGNTEEVKIIARDVRQNLEKILHHGKRADAIVKGMLQHSRSSGSIKELTDINALADEYFRLAYHGLRAKDKSFNATLQTDHDQSIGSINIIQQDIGRAILNLITNAFYAVTEKSALAKTTGEEYEPTVSITTRKINGKIELSIKDNGNGIPHKVLDKIFQPFFTTKPTGQGTGLGLSLTYDIVKAHGGELKVATEEGKGSVFTIQLPMN